ncbi:MAG TPA: DNA methyltransferase [Jiangellaceae bacterium]
MPERYRIAAVDTLGLIARAVVIWSKPNGLPESVTDRVRRSHEDWVHLVKLPRYYAAVDTIRQPHARSWTTGRNGGTRPAVVASSSQYDGLADAGPNPLGALPGSVWTVPTEPLTVPAELGVDHFAAFPTEWPRRIIQGWSPSGICAACGEGRRPLVEREYEHRQNRFANRFTDGLAAMGTHGKGRPGSSAAPDLKLSASIVGEVCACPEPTAATHPAVVLDPCGGTGTVALVAHALGRTGITVDRSADYSRLAQWRTTDPGQLAKVLGVPKPPPQLDGQAGLFEVAS